VLTLSNQGPQIFSGGALPYWKRLSDLEAETEVPTIMVDHRGIIARVNREFERQFGWLSSEAVGRPLTIIIPETMRDAHLRGVSPPQERGERHLWSQPVRLPAVTKSGREFVAEHFIIGEKRGREWAFGAAIREMIPRLPT